MAPRTLTRDPAAVAREIVAGAQGDDRWLDAFSSAFADRRQGELLRRVLERWGLTQADAAAVFGVSRQAVGKWIRSGVPAERFVFVADLAAATAVLEHHLKHDRIPAVVRRHAEVLGGRSLLDLVASGDGAAVLSACESMFDFARIQG